MSPDFLTLEQHHLMLGPLVAHVESSNLSRDELYTDVRLNDVLCERYQVHMDHYGRKVLKRHDKVLTASSDIGERGQSNRSS